MDWLALPRLRPFVALAALASLLLNLALLVPSLYMLEVFDRVFASRSVETLTMLSALALLALLLGFAMDRARGLLLAQAGRIVDESLSPPALTAALADTAAARADADRSALLDIGRLRAFLAGPAVQALFDAPWLPVYLLVIFALHPVLGIAATASAAALFALGLFTERFVRADTERAVASGRAATLRVEALTRNAEVLLGMRMLDDAMRGWHGLYGRMLDVQQRLAASQATLSALGRTLRHTVQVVMLALGAWLVIAGDASPGIMVAATVLIARALQPVEHLIAGWKSLIEVRGAWRRLHQQKVDAPHAKLLRLPALRGELALERVTLVAGTDGQRAPLLKGVSLGIAAGECLGLIGPSGSGKTTLLRAMLGLREPQAGSVRLDGVELSCWPREQLTGAIGYLPQDVELFAGSVAHNIARLADVDGNDAAVSARVVEAAQRAGVHELIARLPNAYDTDIGDGGVVLSGGQRQRIGLARALYGSPKLVLLDEPNAHLDAEGEDALVAAIGWLKQTGATVVLVSHRPALMHHADRLAVLRDGAIEIVGPREQVLARLAQPATVRTIHPLRTQGAQA